MTTISDGVQLGLDGLDRAASAPTAVSKIDRLAPIARGLAASGNPITVADLREEAVRRGILTGREQGRELSYLGAVMKAAGLRPLDSYRRSQIDQSHGNLNREWML